MAKSKITVREYLKKLSESGSGHGLFGHSCRTPEWWINADEQPHAMVKAVDYQTVALANERCWTLDTLADFADSKFGRYCGDAMSGGKDETWIVRELRRYMDLFEKESK